jgi:cyclase
LNLVKYVRTLLERVMKTSQIVVLVLIVLLPWIAYAEETAPPAEDRYWTIEKVADGVWAALQPHDRRFNDCNVVVIERDLDLVVIDAPANADAVHELMQEIGQLSERPVRFVINTHWHGDHTQGNALYRKAWGDGVSFIGHTTLAEDVPERAAPDVLERVERLTKRIPEAEAKLAEGLHEDGRPLTEEETEQQRVAIDRAKQWLERNRDAEFLAPDVTYSDSMILQRGMGRIELFHFRAHTRGDTVVYLPGEEILITGDLLDDMPFVGHGHPREWLATLETLAGFEFDRIIPGHGPVFEGREQMQRLTEFFTALVTGASDAVVAGKTLEQTQSDLDLSAWRDSLGRDDAGKRFFDQTLAEAIERAYTEASQDK